MARPPGCDPAREGRLGQDRLLTYRVLVDLRAERQLGYFSLSQRPWSSDFPPRLIGWGARSRFPPLCRSALPWRQRTDATASYVRTHGLTGGRRRRCQQTPRSSSQWGNVGGVNSRRMLRNVLRSAMSSQGLWLTCELACGRGLPNECRLMCRAFAVSGWLLLNSSSIVTALVNGRGECPQGAHRSDF